MAGGFDYTDRTVVEIDSIGLGRDRDSTLLPLADIAVEFDEVRASLEPRDPNVADIGDCPIGVQRGTMRDRFGALIAGEEFQFRCLAEGHPIVDRGRKRPEGYAQTSVENRRRPGRRQISRLQRSPTTPSARTRVPGARTPLYAARTTARRWECRRAARHPVESGGGGHPDQVGLPKRRPRKRLRPLKCDSGATNRRWSNRAVAHRPGLP